MFNKTFTNLCEALFAWYYISNLSPLDIKKSFLYIIDNNHTKCYFLIFEASCMNLTTYHEKY